MSEKDNMSKQEQDKLEAVRDLLFGQNVKEYRGEISELKQFISKNRDEIESSISNLESKYSKKLDDLDKVLKDRFKTIEKNMEVMSESKMDRGQLAKFLRDLANQIES
ncbi:hypothetical protein [Ekhidna sp.]|uniref:hypothetical protein n=1 Tax=Ekhidna sp. TaxID=2608089 RepID=UPI0032986B29